MIRIDGSDNLGWCANFGGQDGEGVEGAWKDKMCLQVKIKKLPQTQKYAAANF